MANNEVRMAKSELQITKKEMQKKYKKIVKSIREGYLLNIIDIALLLGYASGASVSQLICGHTEVTWNKLKKLEDVMFYLDSLKMDEFEMIKKLNRAWWSLGFTVKDPNGAKRHVVNHDGKTVVSGGFQAEAHYIAAVHPEAFSA